jgi:hypothetical protein
MSWLDKMQQNVGALVRSGQIKPETASKLEQFAIEQQNKVQNVSGLTPVQIKSNQDKQKQQEQADSLGSGTTDKLKELFSGGEQMNTSANLGNFGDQLGAAFPSATATPSASSLSLPSLGASSAAGSGSMLGLGSLMTSDKNKKTSIKDSDKDMDSFVKALKGKGY